MKYFKFILSYYISKTQCVFYTYLSAQTSHNLAAQKPQMAHGQHISSALETSPSSVSAFQVIAPFKGQSDKMIHPKMLLTDGLCLLYQPSQTIFYFRVGIFTLKERDLVGRENLSDVRTRLSMWKPAYEFPITLWNSPHSYSYFIICRNFITFTNINIFSLLIG